MNIKNTFILLIKSQMCAKIWRFSVVKRIDEPAKRAQIQLFYSRGANEALK